MLATAPVPEHVTYDPNAILEQASELAPVIAHWRDVGEHERRMPSRLFETLRDSGFFSLAVPRAVGGAEMDDDALFQVIEEYARLDGSVAWNVMIAATGAKIASYLPEDGARDVYARGVSTVIAGSLLPKGVAVPVQGGFCVSGGWPLASGCHHAEWMLAPAVVSAARAASDGGPDMRAFYVPVSECEILDTWTTTGLRGTGSHDFQVADVFVPEKLSFPLRLAGRPEPGALVMPNFIAYGRSNVAAVALGIARDAIESFKEVATKQTPSLARVPLARQHTTHERIGRAEALVRAGRAFLRETVRELPASWNWSSEIDAELNARVRLASAHAAQSAAEAVDLLFTAGGTSSIYATSRLERCFRDVHMVTQHVAVAPSNIEMVGQYFLGLGLEERR